jgi:metallo-beta-lactamase family protein
MDTTLTFAGGAGTVTGSKHLLSTRTSRVLLDCGMFQGLKALRLRNWAPMPFAPSAVDAVVLSHAHIDHSGALPILVRDGFDGLVHCTAATAELLGVMLRDAAHLQEEDAERANRRRYSKHHPALPLYTTADAERALQHLAPQPYGERFEVAPGVDVLFRRAGHILGSATIDVCLSEPRPIRVVFSGDLGRWGRPILHDPELVPEADVLLVESTYGDRVHAPHAEDRLVQIVRDVADRRRTLVIPAFAVGRSQELVWILRDLEERGRIPVLPVVMDSPMAIDVTGIHLRHADEHDSRMRATSRLATHDFRFVRTAGESRALNDRQGPMILISASGMATGGRVLHHLAHRLPDPRTVVLLAGFQAAGTRGRSLADGARTLRIHGADVPVRATIEQLDGLSAHADRDDLLRWARGFRRPPRQTWVVHGEPQPADRLAAALRSELGWRAAVAADRETVAL